MCCYRHYIKILASKAGGIDSGADLQDLGSNPRPADQHPSRPWPDQPPPAPGAEAPVQAGPGFESRDDEAGSDPGADVEQLRRVRQRLLRVRLEGPGDVRGHLDRLHRGHLEHFGLMNSSKMFLIFFAIIRILIILVINVWPATLFQD